MLQDRKTCVNCGNEIGISDKICNKCGCPNKNINDYNISNINNNLQNNIYSVSYPKKQEFNWLTLVGILCGIVSIFVFWWLSSVGLSLEIKALNEIKNKNQKGRIIAFMGISLCSANLLLYIIFNILAIGNGIWKVFYY